MEKQDDDEDLHQCGRCQAMFRRLADYFAHKHSKSCRRYLDGETQTSPVPRQPSVFSDEQVENATNVCQTSAGADSDLVSVVRQSLDTSLVDDIDPVIDEACLSPQPAPSVYSGWEEVTAATDAEPDVTNDVADGFSHSSLADADTGEDVMVADPQPVADEAQNSQSSKPEVPAHYHCPQCDFTSKFRDDFDQHLRRQHGVSTYVCVDCLRAYTDAHKLQRHQQNYCAKTPARKKQDALLSVSGSQEKRTVPPPKFLALDKCRKTSEEEVSGSDAPFRCRMCSETFADYDAVRAHVSTVHSAVARPGICRFCGAWFATPYKLRRHVTSSVHDDVPTDVMASFKRQIDRMSIRCTPEALCLLRRARAERRRQQLAALGSNGNECVICRQTFSARSALVRHRKVVHGRRSAAVDAPAPSISCQLCGASFDRRRAYLRHRRDEHRKLPAVPRAPPVTRKCPVCDRSFTRADAAARHRATVHTSRQQLPDDVLAQLISFDDSGTAREDSSSVASSTCFVCAQPTPTAADLLRHLELFHRVWVPRRDGPVPPGLFDDIPAIPASLRHIDDALAATQTPHSIQLTQSGDLSREQIVPDRLVTPSRSHTGPVSSSTLSSSPSSWSCAYCGQLFKTLDAVYRHKVDAHRLEAVFRCVHTSCRLTFRILADYRAHVTGSGHSQAAFICAMCNEHCADLAALLSHRGSAHRRLRASRQSSGSAGSILCDQCGQTFSRRAALVQHRAVVHRRASSLHYACSQCERRFVKREHLQRHIISRHANARPYVCRAVGCGRAFKRKDKLQEHYRCHSADRLHACTLCGRAYRQRDGLRQHQRTHQPLPVTSSTVTLSADCTARRRSCRRCSATFNGAGKLAEHLRSVHGRGAGKDIYAHRCNVCGKTFPRPERVRRHAEREHNLPADWSHRCAACGKGFAGLRSYQVHLARHHAAEDDNRTSARRGRRRANVRTTTTTTTTTTTESSPARVVVVTGRHQSTSTAVRSSCDVTDAPSTSHCFNRFFVPSTPSAHHHHHHRQQQQQSEQTPQSERDAGVSSSSRRHSSSLDRLYCAATTERRLHDHSTTTSDHIRAPRRLSFEPLPYLHHPTRKNHVDYSSYYTPGGYHHPHRPPATPHRTQFGAFYPSARFGYPSQTAAGCTTTPHATGGLFSADRAAADAALPFVVQAAEPPCLAGQSVVDRGRASEFAGSSLATAFPSAMAGDYCRDSSSVPLRPLATQPAGASSNNAYCPVPPTADPTPSVVGRWFDSVPTLLPPPVDTSNHLDAVRWPPRPPPYIDGLRPPPRYPFSMEPPVSSSHAHSQQSRGTAETAASAGGPGWSTMERSCLLNNCRSVDHHPAAAGAAGLMLGSRRYHAAVNHHHADTSSLYGPRTTSAAHCDTTAVPPTHGMLSFLPHW